MSTTLDTCIIVEPREHDKLIPVINNVIENVPKDTLIQVYHGTRNKETLVKTYKHYLNEKVFLYDLKVDNLQIDEYSKLLTSVKFYNNVKGENMLIFQTDSCINANNKDGYVPYLGYDYVGAPFSHNDWIHVKNNPGNVGNGGFSLRRKSSCIKAIQTMNHLKHVGNGKGFNEDTFFINVPFFNYPKNAKSFSVEHCFHANPYGLHSVWKYWHLWSHSQRQLLCSNFKELKTIFDINNFG